MQRVFAAIYAIYKKVVLKHYYNKQIMLQRDSSYFMTKTYCMKSMISYEKVTM